MLHLFIELSIACYPYEKCSVIPRCRGLFLLSVLTMYSFVLN